MNCSLIISVYKNIGFLKVILDNLHFQSVLPGEIIISEDGRSEEMAGYLEKIKQIAGIPLVHLTQQDDGWRKNKALNRAILSAKSDYLIFIDGDCVLHTKFIANHLKLRHPKRVLAGKRVKLSAEASQTLINDGLLTFQKTFRQRFSKLKRQGSTFMEEGIALPMNALTAFAVRLGGISSIKGCNFSAYKQAFFAINGFDEDYTRPAIGEDHDLVWRFKGREFHIVPVRYFCIQYHLDHPESWNSQEENQKLYEQKVAEKHYACRNGLIKQ